MEKIKSITILKQIFKNIVQRKLLEIIKKNKKIKNRLNINVNNYKDYSEKYSQIEIELKIIKDKYGKFINISKKENESFFHIYLNNNDKEVKKYDINEKDKINKLKIIIDHQINSFQGLFKNCKCIESIFFKKFFRKNIINISEMFYGNSLLKEIDFTNFKTDNIIDMSEMFYECNSIQKLNLDNFVTDNVENMSCMFVNCYSLEELNINNFKTNNVKDMSGMFYGCKSLKKIILSSFNTENAQNMSYMFYGCSSLENLNLNNFKTNNVKEMNDMFDGCSLLKKLDISNFNVSKETNMSLILSGCNSLEEIYISKRIYDNANILDNFFEGLDSKNKEKILFIVKNNY